MLRKATSLQLSLIALLAIFCATWWWRKSVAQPAIEPEPLWHNGIIVEVRHCENPLDERATLRCAALLCAQRATQRLTNAQQTTLKLDSYVRDASNNVMRISGSLDQYLRAPTLPTGFYCEVASLDRVEVVFLFGGVAGAGR